MRMRMAVAVMGALGVLQIVWAAGPASGARPESANVTQVLDDCRDDEIIPEERLRLCSALIDDTDLAADVRAEALVNRGIVMLGEGEPTKAMADFDAAIVLNPLDPVAHAYRGEVFKVHGQLEQARGAYDTAVSLDSNSADLFANRGDIYRKLGAPDKARADFEAALKIERAHDTAMAGLEALAKK